MRQFTISLDFEIGWGSIENDAWKRRQAAGVYAKLRNALPVFLSALDKHEISLTWATVGAMISQPDNADFDHLPDLHRQKTQLFLREAAAETKDGRDLFDMVRGTQIPQEIGSHTFSHCRWSIPEFDKAAQRRDTELAIQTLAQQGVVAKSFVYPLNHYENLEVLQNAGLAIARTAPERPKTRLSKGIEMLLARSPASQTIQRPDGFFEETGSLLYVWGIRRGWQLRRAVIRRQIARGLARAAQGKGDFHLWLHPFNLVETPGLLEDSLQLLEQVASMREKGLIDIVTIGGKAVPQ